MEIIIKNLLKRTQVFNLEAPEFMNVNGEHPIGRPETVTFLPLESKTLHEAALRCREIKAALATHPKRRPTLRVKS